MHMADALLSPAVGGVMWGGALGAILYSARKLRDRMDEKMIPLMGVLGAFIFAGQMINFTIPMTGSSGHIGGGMLLAIVLGPYAAFLVLASVLTVQALFFADGGLLALGANIWNLGFYPCCIGYPLIYRRITKLNKSPKGVMVAAVLAVVVGLQFGSLSVVAETKLSGISELPFTTFLLLMQPIHLAIGVIEGFITAGIIMYVRTLRPDIIDDLVETNGVSRAASTKKLISVIAIFAVIMGGFLSWYASSHPDGLEWAIEKTYGNPEVPDKGNGVADTLSSLQKKTAVLPDYSLPKAEGNAADSWSSNAGTSVSGLVGSAIVLCFVAVFGIAIKFMRRIRAKV